MPIFEYRCTTCNERFEVLASRGEPAKRRCPRCDGAHVQRLHSTFAVGRPTVAAPAPGPCGSQDCACRATRES